MKLCLSCMKKIPLLAGRCPYCLDENQGVHGRIILLILLIVSLFFGGKCYLDKLESESNIEITNKAVRDKNGLVSNSL